MGLTIGDIPGGTINPIAPEFSWGMSMGVILVLFILLVILLFK
ncbi:hypothetical protein [Chengkuizengella marina]|nr:hypothetical protein [Chengkuizengella marina]